MWLAVFELFTEQGCAKIPKRSGIQDPQDPRSGILVDLGSSISGFVVGSWDLGSCMLILSRDPDGSWILLFHFAKLILGILDPEFSLFQGILGILDPDALF